MSRVSFQVRRPDTSGYSTTRYDSSLPPGALDDYDSALRADALQIAPAEFVAAYFEANVAQAYGEVNLEWSLPIVAVADLTGVPEPTNAVLVYSPFGEPETVASGQTLVEAADATSFAHTGLPEGKWAYYGLFIRYQSTGGDDYYEKSAALSELTVRNYGSTKLLWDRIPPYYRHGDTLPAQAGSLGAEPIDLGFDHYGDPVGPLLRFLSVVGYDLDRQRTINDYLMTSRDPQLANGEVLDVLARELGVDMQSSDLGTGRLRLLMDNIGAFRRAKGTEPGTLFYLEAVTGANASIDTANREVTLYSQRVNRHPDPRNKKTGNDYTDWRPADLDELDGAALITFDSRDPQDTDSTNEVELDGKLWKFIDGHIDRTGEYDFSSYPPTPPPGGVNAEDQLAGVMFRIPEAITCVEGDSVSFSVHSGIGTQKVKWARLVDSTTGDIKDYVNRPVFRHGAPYFDVRASASGSYHIEYLVDLRDGNVFGEYSLLIEKNTTGTYFDGSMTRGGWLVGATSVKDFRWSGAADNSPSLYHEDYERTKQLVSDFLAEVLPIDVEATYSIVDFAAIT